MKLTKKNKDKSFAELAESKIRQIGFKPRFKPRKPVNQDEAALVLVSKLTPEMQAVNPMTKDPL